MEIKGWVDLNNYDLQKVYEDKGWILIMIEKNKPNGRVQKPAECELVVHEIKEQS